MSDRQPSQAEQGAQASPAASREEQEKRERAIRAAITALWASPLIKHDYLDDARRARDAGVIEDLVEWSEGERRITFTWHEGTPGRSRMDLVKYCLPGIESPFWAAWPEGKD